MRPGIPLTSSTIYSIIHFVDARRRKLIERFVRRPQDVTLSDCGRLLEMFGWERRTGTGSHNMYHKKGDYPFNLPSVHGREVKMAYKIKLRDFLAERYPEEFEL